MGALFSKKASPVTELEKIEKELVQRRAQLQSLSESKFYIRVYYVLAVTILATIAAAHCWLRYEFPLKAWTMIFILAIAFTLIFAGQSAISWYYSWRIGNVSQKMEKTSKQKTTLLDLVRETFTFKEAKDILNRFDNEADGKENQENSRKVPSTPPQNTKIVHATPMRVGHGPLKLNGAPLGSAQQGNGPPKQGTPQRVGPGAASETPMRPHQTPLNRNTQAMNAFGPDSEGPQQRRGRRSEPIRPYMQQNGLMDKVLDYMCSDGPSQRLALICSSCHSHNGMAQPQEYHVVTYFCFKCGAYNQTAPQRPSNLPMEDIDPEFLDMLYTPGATVEEEKARLQKLIEQGVIVIKPKEGVTSRRQSMVPTLPQLAETSSDTTTIEDVSHSEETDEGKDEEELRKDSKSEKTSE